MIRNLALFTTVSLLFAFACDDPPPDKASPLGSRVELAAGDVWLTVEGNKERLIT
ncbi:MAG: hypothetical protein JRF63_12620, partial [Deltaproteobacteria bacterium]|nr:hypothetical protein [Deltaproteobacteria bacterium]